MLESPVYFNLSYVAAPRRPRRRCRRRVRLPIDLVGLLHDLVDASILGAARATEAEARQEESDAGDREDDDRHRELESSRC